MFACSSIMVTVWIKHCPYLSSSTTDPPGWCTKAHWTPGPQRSGVGGGRSAGPQWCGSLLSSGGWAAAPPEALHHEVWSPPWGCWPSPARSSSQPCWKAAGEGERETCQPLLQKQWHVYLWGFIQVLKCSSPDKWTKAWLKISYEKHHDFFLNETWMTEIVFMSHARCS